MKFLLVLAVVLIGIFVWRSNRGERKPPRAGPTEPPRAIEMVRCDLCGVHCPRVDALSGRRGLYCSSQHRSQAEP